MSELKRVLNEQIKLVSLEKETVQKIERVSKEFCKQLSKRLKQQKIDAEVFIGGSLAKKTLVKKEKYDIDIFVRFNKEYEDEQISELLSKVIEGAKKIHGSRDYYSMIIEGIVFEIIPVLKITKPEQARNITDLSYFHVNYILQKINKNPKLADEIRLAKAFAYAQECYGAESYVHGFSGYALELLVCHYGSFLRFIRSMVLANNKIVIDDKGFYKERAEILIELNESKLQSPIILIDPTYQERNALASLSQDTFEKFKESCKKFLENPSKDFFIKKNIAEEFQKKHKNLRIVEFRTTKQEGDIAGTKSKKFFSFFTDRLKKEFSIRKKAFDYDEEKNLARIYLVLGKKREETIKGPKITDTGNFNRFKKAHPNAFEKGNHIYAKIAHELSFDEYMANFLKKEKKVMKDMSVKEVKLIK
jgi:tRNA nucleotidyltransferase (CCA-adding enzyme)